MIAGTIRQNVQMATMNTLIEEKKIKGFVKKQEDLTPEERMLEQLREQAAQNKEAEYTSGIANKVMSGKKLSMDEIEYLQQKNPELLKKYREMQEEMKAYERQLRNCKTKEEVERVRVNKINGYLAQAKSVSNNPVIPKGEKKAILEEIMARLTNMEKVHIKFVKSVEYKELPKEQEIAKERAELTSERQEAAAEMLKEAGEKQEEIAEESQEEAVEMLPGESAEEVQLDDITELLPGEGVQAGESSVEQKQSGSEKLPPSATEKTEATEHSKKRKIKPTEPEAEDDIAKKAMTLIQSALTKLSEHSYSNTGGSVSVALNHDTGKRIDIKR